MPFLSVADIQDQLPTGFDADYVARLLLLVNNKLELFGLKFKEPTIETRQIRANSDGQRVFSLWFMTSKPTSVKILSNNITPIRTLTEYDDYLIKTHPRIPNLFYQIETTRDYFPPCVLEVTAPFGFMTQVDDVLKAAIVQWIVGKVKISSQRLGGLLVEKAKTDDSEIWFSDDTHRPWDLSEDITKDPDFNEVLNYYLPVC